MELNFELKNLPPNTVHHYPELLTFDDIKGIFPTLHKIADKESEGIIVCTTSDLLCNNDTKFRVCFPVENHSANLSKVEEYEVIQRTEAVICDFTEGKFPDISNVIQEMALYAKKLGYQDNLPYSIVYHKGKKKLLSKNPPSYCMELLYPVRK